jgi:tetratricopeptide (TPR) repeat protein
MKIKYIIISLAILFLSNQSFAQKPIDEEKVSKAVVLMRKMMTDPSQMQTVMTEMQALKLTGAEDKEAKTRMQKEAMNKAGEIKKQVMNTGGITEKQIIEFKENKDRIVPLRDDARINAVLKRNLSDAEIKNYCKAVFEAVKKELHPSVISQSEKIYQDLKAKKLNYNQLGNGAISCFFTNMTKHSLYIYGKICSEDATNSNNLNNYAALLTMQGVEQGAIPVLNYLNKRYARSPYVWSNLSVAWLGLGDLKTAEKYADSCIRFFPGHAAQAHYVKSVVKEGEGDKEKAVEELQISIELGYTREKEMQLRKKNKKPDNLLAKFRAGIPGDVMGLGRFKPPAIPRTYADALVSAAEWKSYYSTLGAEYELLAKRMEGQLKSMGKTSMDYMVKEVSKPNNKDHVYAVAVTDVTNQRMQKISALLEKEFSPKEESFFKRMKQLQENKKLWEVEMEKKEEELSEKYENLSGEGQPSQEMEMCNAYLVNVDEYMTKVNLQYDKYFSDYLSFKKQEFNEHIYAASFHMGKELFEYELNRRKMLFLGAMMSVIYEFPSWALKPTICIERITGGKKWTLPSFKDIKCFSNLQLDLGLFSMSGCDKFKVDQKSIDEIFNMDGGNAGPLPDGSIAIDDELAPLPPKKKTTSGNEDDELAPLPPKKKTTSGNEDDELAPLPPKKKTTSGNYDDELAPIQPLKKTTSGNNNKEADELAPIIPVKRIEFDRSGFTDFQPAPGNTSNPGAAGKNIILAGKPAFEIKAELKNVTVNYK